MVGKDPLESRPLAGHVEDLEGDERASDTHNPNDGLYPSRKKENRFYWAVILLVAAIANILGGVLGYSLAQKPQDLDARCAAYTTEYSPVLKEVRIQYSSTSFNGSFMNEDAYRRPGSPEVDAAWGALGVNYRAGVISREEGFKSGLTEGHVQRSKEYGGGFFVNVEGLHHLHCLDLVRKALYYNYPYYKKLGKHAFQNEDRILQLHVSHCVDILRQVLMCNADTGVLGQVWYNKEQPQAFPDFKTTHKCKNYDMIRQWAGEHQEPEPESLPPNYMLRPAPEDVLTETP